MNLFGTFRIMKIDSFIKNVFDIYTEVKELGSAQVSNLI